MANHTTDYDRYFTKIPSIILRHSRLTSAAKLVYGVMLQEQGKDPWFSIDIERVANRAGLSYRTASRSISNLIETKVIEYQKELNTKTGKEEITRVPSGKKHGYTHCYTCNILIRSRANRNKRKVVSIAEVAPTARHFDLSR